MKESWVKATVSALAAAALTPFAALAADVPLPTLSAPLPVTESSHPWNGAAWQNTPIDLKQYKYVEEEFLASGVANVHNWIPGGSFQTEITGSAEYTTRVIIRRPKDMKNFSGRVVVEIINMSAGYDWTAMWGALWERILANGDVYVGVTSKPNVFRGMKAFDAARYGSLSMPNPKPADQQTCGKLPGEAGYSDNQSKLYENGLAYDIFSQVAALVKSKSSKNPLGMPAKFAYLAGESQSGNYLITYFKYFHKKARVSGNPVYDGYIAEAPIAPTGSPIQQCATPLPAADPQIPIPGRGVPLVMINSQWDFFPYRKAFGKPDSNTKKDKSITWELAGANHGWEFQYKFSDALPADLEKIGFSEYKWSCSAIAAEVPLYMPEKALYQHLIRWAEKGKAPPTAKRIRVKPGSWDIQYDDDNIAKGGLRMPMVQVPTHGFGEGQYFLSPDCSEYTSKVFSSERLKELYGAKSNYVKKYSKVAQKLVEKGYLLQEDADLLIKQAGKVKFAK